MGKLAKKYITQAAKTVPSSQWKERGLKTAWALQKKAQKGGAKSKPKSKPRGKTAGRSSSRASPKGGSVSSKSQKIGAVLKGARAGDTISGPAQGVIATKGGPKELVARYDTKEAVLVSVKGGAVGLLRNVITSKSGAYRGVSQNKILSYVQVFSPEISAASEVSPLDDPRRFNAVRHIAHEGYNPEGHNFSLAQPLLRSSSVLQAVAWAAQKVVQKLGINRMLPKGVNL